MVEESILQKVPRESMSFRMSLQVIVHEDKGHPYVLKIAIYLMLVRTTLAVITMIPMNAKEQ